MTYVIVFKPAAEKELQKLPAYNAAKILDQIATLKDNPRPLSSRKLIGKSDTWRLRVGDYRILYEVEDKIKLVRIYRIRHRKDVYR